MLHASTRKYLLNHQQDAASKNYQQDQTEEE